MLVIAGLAEVSDQPPASDSRAKARRAVMKARALADGSKKQMAKATLTTSRTAKSRRERA